MGRMYGQMGIHPLFGELMENRVDELLHGLTGLSDGWGRSGEILFGEGRGRVEGVKFLLGELLLALAGRGFAGGIPAIGRLTTPDTISPKYSHETQIWMLLDAAARMRGFRLWDMIAGVGVSGGNPYFDSAGNVIRMDPHLTFQWALKFQWHVALHEVLHAEDGMSSVLDQFNSLELQLRRGMLGYAFREAITDFEATITLMEWFNERIPTYPPAQTYVYAKDALEKFGFDFHKLVELWRMWLQLRQK